MVGIWKAGIVSPLYTHIGTRYPPRFVFSCAREINRTIIETYEYLQTLPNEKARQRHIKRVEKGLKEQYTPRMKKLSFAQGKLLIKLIDRQSHQSSYELVKAFMGPFKAGSVSIRKFQ